MDRMTVVYSPSAVTDSKKRFVCAESWLALMISISTAQALPGAGVFSNLHQRKRKMIADISIFWNG
jgi:hypothetical protein